MIQLLSSGHVTLNTEGQALIASVTNSQLTVTSFQLLVTSVQFTVTGNSKIYSCISSWFRYIKLCIFMQN